MKLLIESTDRFARVDQCRVRIWRGRTTHGAQVELFVALLKVRDDHKEEFGRELIEQLSRLVEEEPEGETGGKKGHAD